MVSAMEFIIQVENDENKPVVSVIYSYKYAV